MRRSYRARAPSAELINRVQYSLDDFYSSTAKADRPAAASARHNKRPKVAAAPSPTAPQRAKSKEKARPKSTCVCCNTAASPNTSVVCSGCDQVFHLECLPAQTTDPALDDRSKLWFCTFCPNVNVEHLLTPYRRGQEGPLTQGGRELVQAVTLGRTPKFSDSNRIDNPFGCHGFHCVRDALSKSDLMTLGAIIGSSPDGYAKPSQLTQMVSDKSRKVYCCSDEERKIRGGRYASILRPSATHSLITFEMEQGTQLNEYIANLFPGPSDPFVTSTELLCQQLNWHYEDLDPHCDKERVDKSKKKQLPGWDGIGDRITSLTLRTGCWLFMRETKNHANSFALYLQPGDVYTLVGEARWKWQHGILLDTPPPKSDSLPSSDSADCRISFLWRYVEEYPV